MPKVNGKHFSYGPKGKMQAVAYSKKTGKPLDAKAKKKIEKARKK